MAKQPETPPLAHAEGRRANNAEEWKLERTCRRKRLPLQPEVPLQNWRGKTRIKRETLDLGKAAQSAAYITTSSTKKRWWVIVVGDSLLRGTEALIDWPDTLWWGMYCLPGSHVRDITKRLPSLVQSTDCYPLLLFHVAVEVQAAAWGVSRRIAEPWEWW